MFIDLGLSEAVHELGLPLHGLSLLFLDRGLIGYADARLGALPED
jgi:hypothetical protein